MIVTKGNFYECVQAIGEESFISMDTETTGLNPYLDDRLFGISISTANNDYYFNFNVGTVNCLSYSYIPYIIFNKACTIFMHNAKFDLAFLFKEGLNLLDYTIHDTIIGARLIHSDLPRYSLDALTGKKDNTVEKYITKNKLWTKINYDGKKDDNLDRQRRHNQDETAIHL